MTELEKREALKCVVCCEPLKFQTSVSRGDDKEAHFFRHINCGKSLAFDKILPIPFKDLGF